MVEGSPPVGPGERLALDLSNNVRLPGTVAWKGEDGFGLAFDAPADLAAAVDARRALASGQTPRAPRVEVGCTALVQVGDELRPATLVDISEHGAKLHLASAVEADEVRLSLPGLPALQGTVRWQEDGRLGIAFQEGVDFSELSKWLSDLQRKLRKRAASTVAFLTAACGVAGPSLAGTARGDVIITATVVQSCSVSNGGTSTSVSVACTPGTFWTATGAAAKPQPSASQTSAGTQTSQSGAITITYF